MPNSRGPNRSANQTGVLASAWAAGRVAPGLCGGPRAGPPLALGSGGEGSAERFPTLRHLRDAFELDLLLSGTPAPTDVERRMAIAALVAKSRQLRGTSAGPKER